MNIRSASAVDGPGARYRRSSKASSRLALSIGVLLLLFLLCAPFFVDIMDHGLPQPVRGVVSFGRHPVVAPGEIRGEWRFVWRQTGTPGIAPCTTTFIKVPDQWSGLALPGGVRLPATGIGSFELTLRDLPKGRYILHIPVVFGAHRVFLNGELVSSQGIIGNTAAATRTTVRSDQTEFQSDGSPVALRVDISSFHHRDSGFGDPPVIGSAEAMRRWIALEWAKDLLFHSALLMLAASTLAAFLYRRRDTASLFASLSALGAIPGTAVISHDNLLLIAFPQMSFTVMMMLQYLCSTGTYLFFPAYARGLYPQEWDKRLFWALQAVTGTFLLVQIGCFAFAGTRVASYTAVYLPFVAMLVFLAILVVVIRAALRGRDGAAVTLFGVAAFTFGILNSTLLWSRLVPDEYLASSQALPLGLLVLLFAIFVVSAERASVAVLNSEQANQDLRELLNVSSAITSEVRLEALLQQIVEVTSRILDADRSSLLLHDEKAGDLWSMVAEQLSLREIRIAADSGLVGHAFQTGETINTADAYADPRFNPEIDRATGYRTKTVLTMPLNARDGRRIGVMQVINKRDGKPFSKSDEARLAAFAAQAAIAIDNATLFAEVVEARNYNESILRSMATGVVTLDSSAEIGKLNDAALRILQVSPGAIEGLDAHQILAQTNPWLIAEIDSVAATGEAKLLFDVDMRTGAGETIAANISIVPLVGETSTTGLLILIDDISEGKRLQGAMRRFMTQKVVDQVMAQRDDFLFGSACEASVLFADIRNFTTMAESLTPRETVDMLNEVFTELFEAVAGSDGVLDKFIGDAIMAVYGAPISSGHDARNAVESALNMVRLLDGVNARRADRGFVPLRLGIGITSGEVVAGTIGSPKRMDYTVIGDSVNLAARLQDLTKHYKVEILICERTAAAVRDFIPLRELDRVTVRGRQQSLAIFEVLRNEMRPAAAALEG